MEQRVEKERHGRAAEEIQKLNLDNCPATEIEGLTDEYKNLVSLSLVNVGLTSLKGLPNLPKLKKLDLSDNRISSDLSVLHGCPGLSYLNLSGNQIKDIDTLQPLKTLKELRNLDLFNCEVTNVEGYKEKVFELLEGLLFLDGFDKNDQEADIEDGEEDSEGDEDERNGDHVVDLDGGEEDDDDDSEDEDEVGLDYLQKPGLEDESDGEDFAPEEEEENEADDLDEEDSEEESNRGVKRKRDDDDDGKAEEKEEI
jgi:Leucine-rich repeat (LRR) protein